MMPLAVRFLVAVHVSVAVLYFTQKAVELSGAGLTLNFMFSAMSLISSIATLLLVLFGDLK